MTLDDVYGYDQDRVPPKRESQWEDTEPPELEWDQSEVTTLVDSIMGPQHSAG